MNNKLTNYILEHILSNLGFFDDRSNSIISTKFLIDDKIVFEDSDGESHNSVYVCQNHIGQNKITLAATIFKDSKEQQDGALVVKMDNCPSYGCFLSLTAKEPSDGIIAFSLKNDAWMPANMFIQSSLLGGMEQLREIPTAFDVCADYKSIYQLLVSFIKYRENLDEG